MSNKNNLVLGNAVKTYAQIISAYGPNSEEAKKLRKLYKDDVNLILTASDLDEKVDFADFADALDQLYFNLKKQKDN